MANHSVDSAQEFVVAGAAVTAAVAGYDDLGAVRGKLQQWFR